MSLTLDNVSHWCGMLDLCLGHVKPVEDDTLRTVPSEAIVRPLDLMCFCQCLCTTIKFVVQTFHYGLCRWSNLHSRLMEIFLFYCDGIKSRESMSQIAYDKVCIQASGPPGWSLIPVSVAWSDWKYFFSSLDGMLVHRTVTPIIKFAGTFVYLGGERHCES